MNQTAVIAAALLALLVGPGIYRVARRQPWALHVLNGFVLTSVCGLVFLYVLPEAVAVAGGWVIAASLIGLALPLVFERIAGVASRAMHNVVLWGALLGLMLHTIVDGIALTGGHAHGHSHGDGTSAIALAVIVHRFPVGLAIWTLVRPTYGRRWAWATLATVAVGTLLGFGAGDAVIHYAEDSVWMAVFQALVGGSLLHVVTHGVDHDHDHAHGHHAHGHHAHESEAAERQGAHAHVDAGDAHAEHGHGHHAHGGHDHGAHDHGHHAHEHGDDDVDAEILSEPSPFAEGVGALLGLALLLVVPLLVGDHGHGHEGAGYGDRLLLLGLESAPALLLGFVLAGVIGAMIPSVTFGFMSRGPSVWQAAKGAAVGIPLPVCSCGVVPLYESLVRRGVPPAAAMAFFIATPEIGIESLLLTIPLIGVEFAVARLVVAAVVALLVGVIVGSFVPRERAGKDGAFAGGKGLGGAVAFIRDVVDDTGAWIIAGLMIAAVFDIGALSLMLQGLPAWLEVTLFALVGIPIYVCASGATPVAAALIMAGVSPGAGLAFLLAGPSTNVTTFGVLSRLHGRGVALAFGAVVTALAVASGLALNAIWAPAWSTVATAAHHEDGGLWGALQWGALIVLVLAFTESMLRRGPRTFLSDVFEFGESGHSHGEDEEESCGSCCGSSCSS